MHSELPPLYICSLSTTQSHFTRFSWATETSSGRLTCLQPLDDGVGVLSGVGLATKVTSDGLTLSKDAEDGVLDLAGVLGETHVLKHHDGRKQESSGVGEVLAGNIGGRTVDSLEDGALVTNVAGRGQTKTTNETSTHIRQNVTVEVGHDEDLVVVWVRVGNHLQAGVVEQLGVKLDVRIVLGDVTGSVEEKAVRHLHNGGLVDDADLALANAVGILECKTENSLRSLPGDQLDALHDTIDDNMLNSTVFALGVLTDQDGVHVVVRSLVAGDRLAGTQVGEEVEGSAQSQVQRNVTLANRSGQGTLEGNVVTLNAVNRGVGDDGLAVLELWRHIDGFPLDRHLRSLATVEDIVGDDAHISSRVDVLDSLGDLRSDTITLNQRHSVFALV
jgi:hypothetical protein